MKKTLLISAMFVFGAAAAAASSSWKKCFYAGSHIMSVQAAAKNKRHRSESERVRGQNKYNKSPCRKAKRGTVNAAIGKSYYANMCRKKSTKKCHHQASGKSF